MKSILKNYIKMIKCGFFNFSILFSLINMLFIIIFSRIIISKYVFYTWISLISLAILAIFVNEISENRYALYSKLPIKNEDIIKIFYLHIYTLFSLCFICTIITSTFNFNSAPIFSPGLFLLWLLFWNLFIPNFSSPQLKLSLDKQEDASILWAAFFISFLCLALILSAIQNHIKLQISFTFIACYSLVLVMLCLSILFTSRISYKNVLKKVMNTMK